MPSMAAMPAMPAMPSTITYDEWLSSQYQYMRGKVENHFIDEMMEIMEMMAPLKNRWKMLGHMIIMRTGVCPVLFTAVHRCSLIFNSAHGWLISAIPSKTKSCFRMIFIKKEEKLISQWGKRAAYVGRLTTRGKTSIRGDGIRATLRASLYFFAPDCTERHRTGHKNYIKSKVTVFIIFMPFLPHIEFGSPEIKETRLSSKMCSTDNRVALSWA